MDYYGPMKRFPLAAGAVLLLAMAQAATAQPASQPTPAAAAADGPATPSPLSAELFYELLLGEINARGEEPGTGYSLILDAARKTNDPALYQRAVEVAFQ